VKVAPTIAAVAALLLAGCSSAPGVGVEGEPKFVLWSIINVQRSESPSDDSRALEAPDGAKKKKAPQFKPYVVRRWVVPCPPTPTKTCRYGPHK